MRNVSSLYNFIASEPLMDWLDRHGAAHGYRKDTEEPDYIEATDHGRFVREKGKAFEERIFQLIADRLDMVVVQSSKGNQDAGYQQTLRLLEEGQEAIAQGLLRSEERGLFGVPDLIVRCDALERLVPGTFDGPPPAGHVVVDVKFKTVHLLKSGVLSQGKDAHPWERAQVSLYEAMLAETLGRERRDGYVLGRKWEQSNQKGRNAFERLGRVKPDDDIWQDIEEGLRWLDDLDADGEKWDPKTSDDPRLLPDPENRKDSPWHKAKKNILEAVERPDDMEQAFHPPQLMAGREEWHSPPKLEFFVDFETFSDLNDDLSALPDAGGTSLIFMVGCGHAIDGEWQGKPKVWTATHETEEAEAEMLDAWFEHMQALRQRVAPDETRVPVYHWEHVERTQLISAMRRHGTDRWGGLDWYDLLNAVFRKEKVRIRGARSQSIKEVVKALYEQKEIGVQWPEDGPGDGLTAMTGAWWCYSEAARTNAPIQDVAPDGSEPLMPLIEEYNRIDCEAIWAILDHLRKKR